MQSHDNERTKQRVTPCVLFGLLCFFLGGISLIGYFLTPDDSDDYNLHPEYQFSDKPDALPFGIVFMLFGFLLLVCVTCCQKNGADC